jgi:hypothetical protein
MADRDDHGDYEVRRLRSDDLHFIIRARIAVATPEVGAKANEIIRRLFID